MRVIKNIINKELALELMNQLGIEKTDEVLSNMEKTLSSIFKQYVPKEVFNIQEPSSSLLETYPDIKIDSLPKWVNENILDAKVIGNTKQTVVLKDGRRYHLKNSLNHLSGGEWVYFTNSVLNTRYLTTGKDSCAHHIRKIHTTPKPPLLMKDIIEFFTKEGELVLDYFMGVGGTLLGASMCNRKAAGIDLSHEYVAAYQEAAEFMNLEVQPTMVGDSLSILRNNSDVQKLLCGKPISLILIDPPYGNMMSKVKTGADIDRYGSNATPFTDSIYDIGNMDTEPFLEKLKDSVELALQYVKIKGHIVVFMKDLQPDKKKVNLLHADVVKKLNEIENIQYKGLKIWADQTAKLFPYGYPFSFVANQIHQYILIFRKEK